jgi:peptidoglycan/xylan/chitin deacetylase (PgdA/CDA1 family)
LVDQVFSLEAGRKKTMILSLLYHDVVEPGQFASSGFPHGDAHIYKLERSQFELHLQKIDQAPKSAKVALLDHASQDIGSEVLLFTFDDGGASALPIAALLEEHGWRGHFFITTDYIGKPGFVREDQIRELHHRGHVVGSHSCSHPARMSHCPPEQLVREWKESARVLSNILGDRLRVASVPGGYYSKRVAEAAANSGIEVLFNSEPTSHIKHVKGCIVLGRYSIQQGVSAETVAGIASGERLPRLRQYLLWNSKKIAKHLGGNYYISLRKSLLRNDGSP